MIDDLKLLELGSRVTFSHVLRRRAESLPDRRATGSGYKDRKVWRPIPAEAHAGHGRGLPNAVPGIVVGLRTLANGVVEYGDYETPTTFTPDGDRVRAVLISYDLRRKPVLVLPEHVSPVVPLRSSSPDEAVGAIREAARVAVDARLEWPSMHWGTEDVHPDAWPYVVDAAVDAVLDSGHVRLIERSEP